MSHSSATHAQVLAVPEESPDEVRRVVIASTIGTIIEWYDFLIYGTAAALVFGKLFFPAADPFVGTLAALGSAAVGFFARPFGGAIFGYFGDRLGRKSMLLISLGIMGVGTFAIGLLPTYNQIGIWAPILLILLRIFQGIGLGGEWGAAALMVLEHAPKKRRGLCGSLVQMGFPIGLVLASLTFGFVSKMPEADFLSYGWRLPFLFSAVLILVGSFIRMRVTESPLFLQMKEKNEISENPVLETILKNPKNFLIAIGLKFNESGMVYMLTAFAVVYATKNLGLPKALMLQAIMIGAICEAIAIPIFGYFSDIIGRRPFYILGPIFTFIFAFPFFWLLDLRDPIYIIIACSLGLAFGHGLMFGPEATYFPELFGARVRYTGASLGFQISAAIGGGLAPVLATALVAYFGGTTGVSILLIMMGCVTLTAALFARETRDESIGTL